MKQSDLVPPCFHIPELRKKIHTLFYYGFSEDDYLTCQELISESNYNTAHIISLWTFLLFAFFSFLSVMFHFSPAYSYLYIIFTIGTAGIYSAFYFLKNIVQKHIIFLFYLLTFMLLLFSTFFTLIEPDKRSVIFPAMLLFFPVLFIDTLFRMICFTLSICTFYSITLYLFKYPDIFSFDLLTAFAFALLAILLHYITQNSKMHRFVNIRNTEILIRRYKFAQKELEIRASYDKLSGLYNRSTFISETEARILCRPHHYMALCILDLDHFKTINDTYGHHIGDEAIIATSQIIFDVLNLKLGDSGKNHFFSFESKNIAGRLGGDEFIILITDVENELEVTEKMSQLLFQLNNMNYKKIPSCLQASIGIVSIASSDVSFDILYQAADSALYDAKKAGKNQICTYKIQNI